ncbi:MAG: hypothetical protein V8R40_05195, partial [Dysosmobacter sp.]
DRSNRILFTNKEDTTVYKTAMWRTHLRSAFTMAGVPFYGTGYSARSSHLLPATWNCRWWCSSQLDKFMSNLMDRAG